MTRPARECRARPSPLGLWLVLSAALCLMPPCRAPAQQPATHIAPGGVRTGIDVLEREGFAPLREMALRHGGRLRIGLLTNQTGRDSAGRRTIDILFHDAARQVPGLALTTLFSPEHGITGAVDTGNRNGGRDLDIPDSRDPATGLPIVSLYGRTDAQRHPQRGQLQQLDAVLIDLQDAGVRFYTYETVVGYFLEAAAETGTAIVILDRPNPLGGLAVQGPISPPRPSYINYMPIPVRHGLTLGELALYFRAEKKLPTQLTVIRMEGWRRSEWFDRTAVMWVDPSTNLRNMTAMELYSGIGLLEEANLSVGRGTDSPFEQIGAPWMEEAGDGRAAATSGWTNARRLAVYLNARAIPGVTFLPVEFTPSGGFPEDGQICAGVRITVTGRDRLDSPELGIEIAAALWKLFPGQFHFESISRSKLPPPIPDRIRNGVDPRRIAADWKAGDAAFAARRRACCLLYR